MCLPRHPAVAYLFLVRLLVNARFVLLLCAVTSSALALDLRDGKAWLHDAPRTCDFKSCKELPDSIFSRSSRPKRYVAELQDLARKRFVALTQDSARVLRRGAVSLSQRQAAISRSRCVRERRHWWLQTLSLRRWACGFTLLARPHHSLLSVSSCR